MLHIVPYRIPCLDTEGYHPVLMRVVAVHIVHLQIDIVHLQGNKLGDSHSRGIKKLQHSLVPYFLGRIA